MSIGSQDAVNRSEWYSFNPISSVTTLGTSGSDTTSTLGGLDQSCADFVLMASPIRGELSYLLQRGSQSSHPLHNGRAVQCNSLTRVCATYVVSSAALCMQDCFLHACKRRARKRALHMSSSGECVYSASCTSSARKPQKRKAVGSRPQTCAQTWLQPSCLIAAHLYLQAAPHTSSTHHSLHKTPQ